MFLGVWRVDAQLAVSRAIGKQSFLYLYLLEHLDTASYLKNVTNLTSLTCNKFFYII